MTVQRLRIALTGGPGGNGVVTLYSRDWAANQAAALGFANTWRQWMPNDVTIHVPDTGDIIDEETGVITGVWNGGDDGGYVGTDSGTWIAGTGCLIRWVTAGLVAGRRVQGRTFIVPLGSGMFTSEGLPSTSTVDAVLTMANTLVSASPGDLVVWSRPTTERVGSIHDVVSASVPVSSTYLRSRRQ